MRKLFSLFAALTLCAGLWADPINPGYNEPEGSFYSCYYFPSGGAASVQVPQLIMPYMDEYTFTSRHGAGDWKMGEQTATGAETFSPKYAFGTYTAEGMPELTARDTTYVYGSGSTSGSARRVYVGDGCYHYITNAKHYVVKQSTMVTKMSSYLKYRTYFFNRPDQVMLVSKILIPITTNRNGETVADLFPAEDSHMKVAVYQATCSRTSLDKYSKAIDYSKRLVDTLTLTVKNYMQSSNAYAGILIAELPEPVSIKGAFCVEITDYETMGPETHLITDNTTGTTSQYLKYKKAGDSQLTVYAASNNFEVAVYGAMPSIAKASEVEAIEIPTIGGVADTFAIYSSTKITAKEITLPEWTNLDTIIYEGDAYMASKKIYIVLSASANPTGADRTGEMVINNLGMKLTCAISQPAPVTPKVGDQFVDATSGLKFEVTAVGEANTVKVMKNDYTGTSYTIPATVKYLDVDFAVTEIGDEAFETCESVQSVTLSEGLITIGRNAFQDCSSLQSINIPAGVTTIDTAAFEGCAFTSINLPASVTTLGAEAFLGCESLQSVTLSEGLITIGQMTFANTGLTSITIPASVTEIGMYAFYAYASSALASVTFLGNACQDAIGEMAFFGVGDPDPALLTLHGTWAKENQPDEDGNWYGGKFELSSDPTALPTLFGANVDATKFLRNGQVIIRKNNKTYNVVGQEVK